MTLAEFAYLCRRFGLTSQQGAFVAALVDAPDGRLSPEAVARAVIEGRARRKHAPPPTDPDALLKVLLCKINQRLAPDVRIERDTARGLNARGAHRTTAYLLSQEGRAAILKAISEAARIDDARNVRLAGAHI